MARYSGRSVRVMIGRNPVGTAAGSGGDSASMLCNANKFTIDQSVEQIDATGFCDTSKVYVPGVPDAKGNVSGVYDDTLDNLLSAAADGAPRKFYMYPNWADPTRYFFGTGTFSNSMEASVSGATSWSADWAAATPVTRSTALV